MTKSNTMTPDHLLQLRFLQDARFSPDGRYVVYAVSHIDDDESAAKETERYKERSTLYLLDRTTGASRPLTHGRALESAPRFSPDGRQLAFLSERGDKPQLYVMPVDGGEPRQLTDLKQGVGSGPAWSPDGATIAFTAGPTFEGDNPPDLAQEAYRLTRNVYRFDDLGYLDQYVQDIYLVDVATASAGSAGALTRLTDDATDNTGLCWAPDGSRLLFLAGKQPDTFDIARDQLCTVDRDGRITTHPIGDLTIAAASWTPDGAAVVFIGVPLTEKPIGSKSDLWRLDLASGALDNRTAGLAVGVGGIVGQRIPTRVTTAGSLTLSADGHHAFARVQEGGNVHLYRIALTGPEVWEPVVTGDRVLNVLDRHDKTLLLAVSDLNTPPNLATVDVDGSEERPLTHLNASLLDDLALPETEHLLFPGPDGVQVEGWFMKPPNGAAPYPTILYIHGGPHMGYGRGFSFDFHMLAGQGYGVLYINHRASTGYGDAFSTAIKGDWGNLDYGDLMAGVDHAIALGLADPDRLGCAGTSGGGNLSCWIVGQTDRFKAAVPQNPVTNWASFYGVSDVGVWFAVAQLGGHPHEIPGVYARCSPITYAHRCRTPTLLVQSENDYRCPAEQSEQFYTVLKANGCTVEMLRQPASAHGASIFGPVHLRLAHLNAMLDWFDRYLL